MTMQVIRARCCDRLDHPRQSSLLESRRWPLCRRPTGIFIFDMT